MRLLRKFLGKFIRTKVISSSEDITKVSLAEENQHSNELLAVGPKARTFLLDFQDDIDPATESRFYKSVRSFYKAVVEKMIKKFPFDDTTLKDLAFLNPRQSQRQTLVPDSVCRLLRKFPSIDVDGAEAKLTEEVQDFILCPESELPNAEDTENFWGGICKLKDEFTEEYKFPTLSALASALLSLPNSNAASERAFSIVRRINTEFRSELGHDTLCSLLSVKLNAGCSSKDYTPSTQVLSAAKSACCSYNKAVGDAQ